VAPSAGMLAAVPSDPQPLAPATSKTPPVTLGSHSLPGRATPGAAEWSFAADSSAAGATVCERDAGTSEAQAAPLAKQAITCRKSYVRDSECNLHTKLRLERSDLAAFLHFATEVTPAPETGLPRAHR
jgi:hypothetical protein